MKRYAFAAVPFLLGVMALLAVHGPSWAADSDQRLIDKAKLEVSTGTAVIDSSAATWTAYVALVSITPDNAHALQDVRVWISLDKATTGFADATGWDTETIQFVVQRKVDGTNWIADKRTETAALAADDADGYGFEFIIGEVGPDEDVRIAAKVSAEAQADLDIPYVVYYRSGVRATITAAAAD